MKFHLMSAAMVAAAVLAATPANAAITLSAAPGSSTYTGPVPTYDFETAAPLTGGSVVANTVPGVATRPAGSTGNFAAFGPSNNGSGVLNLASFADILSISFIWGSLDNFNSLNVLGAGGSTLATANGSFVMFLAQGFAAGVPRSNPIVTLTFTGADRSAVEGLRFNSTQNAFEIDNVVVNSVAPVPEPATWAMMLLGFGLAGFGLRRRRQTTVVSFA